MQTGATSPMRIPMKGGNESDILCRRARHLFKFTKRAGMCRAGKNSYARRFRKIGRLAAHDDEIAGQ